MKIDMKELIKEAENLYQQIDKIQLDLVKSRLDVCEEQKWKAIKNDNLCVKVVAEKFIDKANPRVEFKIVTIE